eukprot:TRINITY_DN2911_c0_g1_i1.p2 TRINITY_DN2911_c0_g1~~TRINITY_DN2911_c0_g1_i1.p2  ORF type:complete len:239 (+),score=56.22 TRINITY_DN2911_c0_g1_i1:118-834(+)
MIRRPPRSTLSSSSAASDVYKRQQQSWLAELSLALNDGFTDSSPVALPTPLNFSVAMLSPIVQAAVGQADSPECVIQLARVCCNSGHQIQNLAAVLMEPESSEQMREAAPGHGKGRKGYKGGKGRKGKGRPGAVAGKLFEPGRKLDGLGGKLENQSRGIMCVVHRDLHIGGARLQPKMRIAESCNTMLDLLGQIRQITQGLQECSAVTEITATTQLAEQAADACASCVQRQIDVACKA